MRVLGIDIQVHYPSYDSLIPRGITFTKKVNEANYSTISVLSVKIRAAALLVFTGLAVCLTKSNSRHSTLIKAAVVIALALSAVCFKIARISRRFVENLDDHDGRFRRVRAGSDDSSGSPLRGMSPPSSEEGSPAGSGSPIGIGLRMTPGPARASAGYERASFIHERAAASSSHAGLSPIGRRFGRAQALPLDDRNPNGRVFIREVHSDEEDSEGDSPSNSQWRTSAACSRAAPSSQVTQASVSVAQQRRHALFLDSQLNVGQFDHFESAGDLEDVFCVTRPSPSRFGAPHAAFEPEEDDIAFDPAGLNSSDEG